MSLDEIVLSPINRPKRKKKTRRVSAATVKAGKRAMVDVGQNPSFSPPESSIVGPRLCAPDDPEATGPDIHTLCPIEETDDEL